MIKSFKTVYQGGTGELIEKKSRFIATVYPIQTEEEAITLIEQTKKKYYDANHNCYAYVCGKNDEIIRCSDDGEPAKTAGRPILDVLLLENIHNTLVIVTRYFGGTLLGTGGLVRAYQGAAKIGLEKSIIIEKLYGRKVSILTDYNGLGKLQYMIATKNIKTLNTVYTDTVELTLLIPTHELDSFSQELIEATNGKVTINLLDFTYYAIMNDDLLLFENF